MKFWAKNGAYNWICDFSEYDGVREGVEEVKYTYLETAFWNNYDGKTSPLKEDDGTPIVWYNEQKQSQPPVKRVVCTSTRQTGGLHLAYKARSSS